MKVTLLEVFDRHFKHIKFDSHLAKLIYKYQIGYINSNREYLEFFGSNLLGVHVVRFKDSDVMRLFNDVLDVDYVELSEDLKHVTDVNQDFIISSDVYNLTCMYLIHRFLTSRLLNDDKRYRAAYDCALLFFYRCIAALISYNFRYPADPKIAQAAYSNLSNKYLIKKLGSWHKVMDYRATSLLDKKSIHYKNLITFNNDLTIVYAINDSQGRIKDLVKNYYSEFAKCHAEGERIGSKSSTFLDVEGEEIVKEKTRSVENHVSYIRSCINDRNAFVKDDLVLIIAKINTNTSYRTIKNALLWLTDNYSNDKYNKLIDEFITTIVIYSFHLIHNNIRPNNYRNYPVIISNLKNLYLSSRSTDAELLRIRELGDRIVNLAIGNKVNNSLILATRTSLILYISLRTLVSINK